MKPTINVIIAGLGGQGVVKASDVLSEAAFQAGYEVKKSELHGMSQRGGSVCSDVRFGPVVLSPMVPPGEADFLVVLSSDQVEVNRSRMRTAGIVIEPDLVDAGRLLNRKSLNIALIGALSTHLDIPIEKWMAAIHSCFSDKYQVANEQAFGEGRRSVAN